MLSGTRAVATAVAGWEKRLHRNRKSGLAALGMLAAAVLFACTPQEDQAAAEQPPNTAAQARIELASARPAARQKIDYAALDRRLKLLMEEPAMVGLAVGVVENGRITFLSGYGETVSKSGEQVGPETVFRWASVSKGVASTMIGKLAEAGKLRFSAPIANYAPGLKLPAGAQAKATIGDLMSHRLGLYRNAYDNKLEEGQDPRFLRQTLGQLNLICEPGTCWSYQNIAYDASSDIVQKVTGQSYEQAVREQLFAPIGMTTASMTREGLVNSKSWARPHSAGRKTLEVLDNYYWVPAAGGVNSNVKDLSLWMIAQLGLMPEVVSPSVLQTIHAPLVKTPNQRARLRKFLERLGDVHYGYGWRTYDWGGHQLIGHHGGVSGYRSLILFDPKLKSGVVALWNSNTGQPWGLEFEVMDMLHGLEFRDWLRLQAGAPPIGDQDTVEQGAAS